MFPLDTGHFEPTSQKNAKRMSEEKDLNARNKNKSARDASNGEVSSFHCSAVGSRQNADTGTFTLL